MTVRPIDTDQVASFVAIGRHGSFGKAAEALGITQPAVTARIRNLEAALGEKLLTRDRRQVYTPFGEAWLPHALAILDSVRQGMRAVQDVRMGAGGTLTMAMLSSLAATLLPSIAMNLLAKLPRLSLEVRESTQAEIRDLLMAGAAELGFVLWPWQQLGGELTARLTFVEDLVFVASPTHPLAHRSTVRIDDVVAADAFHHIGSGDLWNALVSARQERGLPSLHLPIPATMELVQAGLGVALVTGALAAPRLATGRLVHLPIEDVRDSRSVAIVHKRSAGKLSKVASDFVEEARRAIEAASPEHTRLT